MAQGIEVEQTHVKISLSEEVQNALESGVNLTFVASAAKRDTFLFFNWRTPYNKQIFKIHRHTLSRHYIVHNSKQNTQQSFSSLRMSLEHISQRSSAFFTQVNEESIVGNFEACFKVHMDKFSLPTPMRINAFWSHEWDLDSGWQP